MLSKVCERWITAANEQYSEAQNIGGWLRLEGNMPAKGRDHTEAE